MHLNPGRSKPWKIRDHGRPIIGIEIRIQIYAIRAAGRGWKRQLVSGLVSRARDLDPEE
jgi:hypothetical protein